VLIRRGPARVWLGLAGGVCICLLAGLGEAAVVEGLSLQQLAERSTLIVSGRVGPVAARWGPRGRRIYRHALVTVEQTHGGRASGTLPGKTLQVVLPGGTLDGIGQLVPGSPELVPGTEVVLFLERVRHGYTPVGLGLGVFRVERSPLPERPAVAVRDLSDLSFVPPRGTPPAGADVADAGTPVDALPLTDLLEAVDHATP